MLRCSRIKKIIALMVICILLLAIISPLKSFAATTTKTYNTHSPLLSGDTMAVDEIDPWELECFGVFLSNFCVPFVDSYMTAFSSTTTEGSQGAGLQALQFATGGDIGANSIVRKMTTYVLDNFVQEASPIVVKNYAINGSTDGTSTAKSTLITDAQNSQYTIEYRPAMLADLLPPLSLQFQTPSESYWNSLDEQFDYSYRSDEIWNHSWFGVSSQWKQDDNGTYWTDFTVTQGVLGEFFIAANLGSVTPAFNECIYDMRNGWDAQLPSQLLLYAAYKESEHYLDTVYDLVIRAADIPIVMDKLGNICARDNNKYIVIIPACLNQHITSNGLINCLNAPMLNTISQSTNKYKDIATITGLRTANNEHAGYNTALNGGIQNLCYKQLSYYHTTDNTSFLYNLASDYMSATDKFANKFTPGSTHWEAHVRLSNSAYVSFIENSFDLSHLRWSTAVKINNLGTNAGLDLQNYMRGVDDNSANGGYLVSSADNSAAAYHIPGSSGTPGTKLKLANIGSGVPEFSYKHTIEMITTSLKKDFTNPDAGTKKDVLATFQAGVQLYVANAGTPNITSDNFYAYFKQLNGTTGLNKCELFGQDGLTSGASKAELVYCPLGSDSTDASFWSTGSFTFDEKQTKEIIRDRLLYAYMIDMYHGKSLTGDSQKEMYAGQLIHNNEIVLNSGDGAYRLYKKAFNITDDDNNTSADPILSKINGSLGGDISDWGPVGASNGKFPMDSDRTNFVRIGVANPALKTAADYLGLSAASTFSLYASDMYYSYLDIYGLINNAHLFKVPLFTALGNTCTNLTSQELGKLIMDNGLTAEQKEEELKENAYLMLSPNEKGKEYRSRIVSGTIDEWLVRTYHNTCYGDTDSEYFAKLNSTSNSFINFDTYSENFLTKAVVQRWPIILPIILLFLSIFIIIFAAVNGKSVIWILSNLVITACMLISLPCVAEVTPYFVNKVAESAFKNSIGTMCVSEAVEDDAIRADITKQYAGYGEETAKQMQAAYDNLSALGTSGSLMLKQDMTRKTIPSNTSEIYAELKGLASAQWLMPNLLSMTGAWTQDEYDDYVYRSVGEKRKELRAMQPTLPSQEFYGAEGDYLAQYGTNIISQLCKYNEYATPDLYQNIGHSTATESYMSAAAHGKSFSHTTDLFLTNVNSLPVSDITTVVADGIISEIHGYSVDNYKNVIGYLQGTETILPYFYLVARDALINADSTITDFNQITVLNFYNNFIQDEFNNNALTVKNGRIIDLVDLEYLFKAYVPYLVGIQDEAKEVLGDEQIGKLYEIYEKEPKSFLFECNWADKLLKAYDYGDDINPFTYPSRYGREMVFSQAQQLAQNVPTKALTDVELRCIEANKKIEEQWTLLINYVTSAGISVDILTEQMALTATIAFNETFSKDRIVNSNYALYPSAISLRTINFDTVMKMVLMSNFGLADLNQESMKIVLAESSTLTGLILFVVAWFITVFVPILINVAMAAAFYCTILSCAYNACIDGKQKLKTTGGATISVIVLTIGTVLYVYSFRWIIGNTNKVLSIKQISAGISLSTGKIFLLAACAGLYTWFLVARTFHTIKNFRDMSMQMWASYSKKTYDGFIRGVTSLANWFNKGDNSGRTNNSARLTDGETSDAKTEVSLAEDGGTVNVKNTEKDPLFTKQTNSADEATVILDDDRYDMDNSGYVERDRSEVDVDVDVDVETNTTNSSSSTNTTESN